MASVAASAAASAASAAATAATAANKAITSASRCKLTQADAFNCFTSHVQQYPPSKLFCSRASPKQEHFYAVAVYKDSAPAVWFAASSMLGVYVTEDFDLNAHLVAFNRRFSLLFDAHGAMDVTEIRDSHTIQASMDNLRVATTSDVHFLPFGDIVCFEAKLLIRNIKAVLLQRARCTGARTYDIVVFYERSSGCSAQEFRLVLRDHLMDTQAWIRKSNCFMFCSPDLPINPKLILQARSEGESWDAIADALLGSDESSEPDSDWHGSDSEYESGGSDSDDYVSDIEMTLDEVHEMLC